MVVVIPVGMLGMGITISKIVSVVSMYEPVEVDLTIVIIVVLSLLIFILFAF